MKRPDADLIRRLIKSKALDNRGLKFGGTVRDRSHGGWSLEKVFGLPYFYLSYKNMNEFDFATGDDLPSADDGTLLGNPVRVLENRGNSADLVRSYASGAEFVYDEFVLSAKSDIQLEHPDSYVETAPVNYWGIVKAFHDHTNFSDAITLFIEYPSAPKQVLVWEGWAESRQAVEPDGRSVGHVA